MSHDSEAPASVTQGPPELRAQVVGVEAEPFAALPTLRFRLLLECAGDTFVQSVLLTTSIRIEVARRRYDPATRRRLQELFGEESRWATTLRDLTWAQITTTVPSFRAGIEVDLSLPCSVDLELGVGKYFDALRDGEVPLRLLFRGTIFYFERDQRLRAVQIPWDLEAACHLPVACWQELVERYYGDMRWLRLRRSSLDRLQAYRARRALGGWDETIQALLEESTPPAVREEARWTS